MGGSIHWWIGDWLNYGEIRYGELCAQGIENTPRYEFGTLANDKWVASHIAASRRRELVPWGHHACVAALEPAQQDMLLDAVINEGLSVRELRLRVAALKALPAPALTSKAFVQQAKSSVDKLVEMMDKLSLDAVRRERLMLALGNLMEVIEIELSQKATP